MERRGAVAPERPASGRIHARRASRSRCILRPARARHKPRKHFPVRITGRVHPPQRRPIRLMLLALATLAPVPCMALLPPSLMWICVIFQVVALLGVLIIFHRDGGLRWRYLVALIAVPLLAYALLQFIQARA